MNHNFVILSLVLASQVVLGIDTVSSMRGLSALPEITTSPIITVPEVLIKGDGLPDLIIKDSVPAEKKSTQFSVAPKEHAKLKLLLVMVGEQKQELNKILDVVKKDLEFSGQFSVDIEPAQQVATKKEVAGLFARGYSLAIFFNSTPANDAIEWRLYDTTQIMMLKGSKAQKRGMVLRGWAHNMADGLWVALTGQEGMFSTKIAYCKDVPVKRKKKVNHVYVTDYDGSNLELLVSTLTVNVAPRWNRDRKNPLVFYSEYTNSNVRMVAVNMHKKRKIASDFDGVNMLAAFSHDGKRVAYCASRGKGSCQIYCYDTGGLIKITDNAGNNVAPCFSEDDSDLFYCSDSVTGSPQIFCYDMDRKQQIRLTDGGYCASPSYCAKRKRLSYSKIVNGTMQLFVYDVVAKVHTQLTFDEGHKEESSWSPCGNYLLFSVEQGAHSRIAMLNVMSNDRRYITPNGVFCAYPAWSSTYDEFPVVD